MAIAFNSPKGTGVLRAFFFGFFKAEALAFGFFFGVLGEIDFFFAGKLIDLW